MKIKITKLSLITTLAITSAFAGGDIGLDADKMVAENSASATCNTKTTVDAKAQAYYYTAQSAEDMFDKTNSQLGTAVTLGVSHKLFDNITANFVAVGYVNLGDKKAGYMEGRESGAYLNVANITATYGETTFVAGRQLIDSPMFGSFDWLLAPSAFEAYTLVNSSVPHLTLTGTYARTLRANNSGDTWIDLTEINGGDNYALGASYSDDLSANLWYYNMDVSNYTQLYTDLGYDFGMADIAVQYVATDYAKGEDSTAYGLKVGTKVANINLSAAYNKVDDAAAGFVERDGLYTSSWNIFASSVVDDSWKVSLSTEVSGVSGELSYAGYGEDGSELDVILGYDVTKCLNLTAVYTNTAANEAKSTASDALEFMATYQF